MHNGHDPDHDKEDNLIRLPSLAEREKAKKAEEKKRKKQEKVWQKQYRQQHHEQMINMPPATKFSILVLVIVYAISALLFDDIGRYGLFEKFAFVPAYYSGAIPFAWPALTGPFTYALLHASLFHLGINVAMMAAFGSGVERWIGGKRLIVFFLLCSLASALFHFALNPFSKEVVIGASGGISGLFSAVLLMMQQRGLGGQGKYGIFPFVILWVVISVVFGFIQMPGSGTVAWAAHIGGFLSGFVFLKPVIKYIK